MKLFTLITGGPPADTSDAAIQFIARNYGWINSHAGEWRETAEQRKFFAGPSAGKDANGKTVAERLRALNPDIILMNYRNGSYTSQFGMTEAMEVEKTAPLAIAVFVTPPTLTRAVSSTDTEIFLTPVQQTRKERPPYYPFKISTTKKQYSTDKKKYVAWLRLGAKILRIDKAGLRNGEIAAIVSRWTEHAERFEVPESLVRRATEIQTELSGLLTSEAPARSSRRGPRW